MTLKLNNIYQGDVNAVLQTFPDSCVDMIMSSPPYWGLRDYGVEGQLGMEKTPEEYVEKFRLIFRELKRVMKPTATLWWNIGDTYGGRKKGNTQGQSSKTHEGAFYNSDSFKKSGGIEKCLSMMPERIAFMAIEEGFILRNKIIWHKPNPMPSSVKDRLNNTYEFVYLFSKQKKYYFDLDAIRVPHKEGITRWGGNIIKVPENGKGVQATDRERLWRNYKGKNPGDFWNITTQPFPEAHFAVFPEKLCETPIKAGCPREVCRKCGKPRERIILTKPPEGGNIGGRTDGWTSCNCNAGFRAGIVLDPFMGAGTTALVARKLGRNYVGIELNPEYIKIAEKRMRIIPNTNLDEFEEAQG